MSYLCHFAVNYSPGCDVTQVLICVNILVPLPGHLVIRSSVPICWAAATAFPGNTTHAMDFGPGGLSGIGPLMSRNLEGHGIRVIVIGSKGKGDTEGMDL